MRSFRLVPSLMVAALVCAGTVVAQSPLVLVPRRMSDVMTSAQMERRGVRSLTREQRLALDAWLTRYSVEVRHGPGNHSSRAALFALAAAASAATGSADETDDSSLSTDLAAEHDQETGPRRYGRSRLAPSTAPPGARVAATPDAGGYVRLADGTLWEIYLPDRTATVTWRRGDYVAVARAAAGSGDFAHLLVNASGRTRALARFAGVTSRR